MSRLPAVAAAALLMRVPGLGCSPRPPTEVPVGAAPSPNDAGLEAPVAHAVADAGDAAPDDAPESGADASSSDAGLEAGSMQVRPEVELEKPYVRWARPRPKGEVAAGAHDELLARWNVGGTSSATFPSNRPGFHPGTRVKVDTRVVSGRLPKSVAVDRRTGKRPVLLSETSLLARARKLGYWPYRLCFEHAVQAHGKLKGGATVLRLAVDRGGRITQSRVLETQLEAPDVVACLADRTQEIELLPPPRRLEVELTVQVWPGDAPLPSMELAPSDLGEPLDADAMAQRLEGERLAFEGCYSEGLVRDPGLWGRLQIHVDSEPRGSVTSAKEAESQFPDRAVARCVVDRLKKVLFPRSGKPAAFEIALRLGRLPERPAGATP